MGPKKKSEKSLQSNGGFMITQDFMGPKKSRKHHFQLEVSSCEHQLWFWFAESMNLLIFFPMRKIPHFLGNREILGFENWNGGIFLANLSPIMSHDQRMVHQWLTSFFRSSDQRMGLFSTAKIQVITWIQGPRSIKLKSVWVFPKQLMLSIESIESIHFSVPYLR
jgi:hypothetical protein